MHFDKDIFTRLLLLTQSEDFNLRRTATQAALSYFEANAYAGMPLYRVKGDLTGIETVYVVKAIRWDANGVPQRMMLLAHNDTLTNVFLDGRIWYNIIQSQTEGRAAWTFIDKEEALRSQRILIKRRQEHFEKLLETVKVKEDDLPTNQN